MHDPRLTVVPSRARTRLLLTQGPDELMRAVLPPPEQVQHERAARTLIEGLSLWLDRPLHVALCASESQSSFCLGLTDEMSVGVRGLFYRVDVVEPRRERPRGQRLRGVGDFADLRQLALGLAPGAP